MQRRVDLHHCGHRLIAAIVDGRPTAAVFADGSRLFIGRGSDLTAALDTARAWVDVQVELAASHRREPHIGTTAEYSRAFRTLRLGDHHAAMLRAHAGAPNRTMTAGGLARAAGYDSFEAANAHYGLLGRKVAEQFGVTPPMDTRRREPVWTRSLAEDAGMSDASGHFRWRMHPEVAEALRELSLG
jgi:hypothetical protein